MSTHDMSLDQIVHRAGADTDCTILILDGAAIALVEDGDDECIGYYQRIREGQYVHNPYEGYSYYIEDGELHSMHGTPDDRQELAVNDGDQKIAYYGGAVAALVAPDMRTYDVRFTDVDDDEITTRVVAESAEAAVSLIADRESINWMAIADGAYIVASAQDGSDSATRGEVPA